MSDSRQWQGWWQASDGNWYPPPAPGPQPMYVQQRQSTNGLAIASMVLGIVWIYGIGAILALVFGYRARREIDQSNGWQTGRGMATAGIILGWIGVGGMALIVVLVVLATIYGSDSSTTYNGMLMTGGWA